MDMITVPMPGDPGRSEAKYTAQAVIENQSTRVVYNLKATLVVDGEPFGEPMLMGPYGDGVGSHPPMGVVPMFGYQHQPICKCNPNSDSALTSINHLTMNEYGDISIDDALRR